VGRNAVGASGGTIRCPRRGPPSRPVRRATVAGRCIETFLSGPGSRATTMQPPGALEPAEIVRRAEAGDPDAEACLARYEDRMARALGSIINVIDPDVIVLGGDVEDERLYTNVPACGIPLCSPIGWTRAWCARCTGTRAASGARPGCGTASDSVSPAARFGLAPRASSVRTEEGPRIDDCLRAAGSGSTGKLGRSPG